MVEIPPTLELCGSLPRGLSEPTAFLMNTTDYPVKVSFNWSLNQNKLKSFYAAVAEKASFCPSLSGYNRWNEENHTEA